MLRRGRISLEVISSSTVQEERAFHRGNYHLEYRGIEKRHLKTLCFLGLECSLPTHTRTPLLGCPAAQEIYLHAVAKQRYWKH